MNNKKTLKNILEEKINQENIYEKIVAKQKNYKNIKKIILVPICLIFVFAIVINSLNTEKNYKNGYEEKNTNYSYSKNESNSSFSIIEDTNYKVSNVKENIVLPFKNLELPKDLNGIENQILYDKNEIVGYRKIYYALGQTSIKRYISITIFNHEIISEADKITIINDIRGRIYTNPMGFVVQFDYEKYHINIETSNIREDELMAFLKAI